MKTLKALVLEIFAGLLLLPALAGAAPSQINYQGRLVDATGNPLSGSYSIAFKIYDVATGGAAIWEETQPAVSVDNGIFNAKLGSVANLPPSVFSSDTRYLGVTIGADPEMSPRVQLLSVPYAIYAASAASVGTASQNVAISTGVNVAGHVAATGYITAAKFYGDGSALINLPSSGSEVKLSSGLNSGYVFVGNSSNQAMGVALGGDATMSNLGALTLANSGVAASTYKSVTVDAKGRVTAGSNPTTLAGYGITDAAAASELAVKLSSGLAAGNIFVGDGSNNASPVVLDGDATMSNLGVLTLANSGVAASTYKSVTVDAKGRVTAGSNPTTLAGYGITDAAAASELAVKLSSGLAAGNIFVGDGSNNASPVVLGGDATMSNLGVLTLANSGVAASTYKSVTVDAKGRVTAGSNPTTLAGYGITDAAAASELAVKLSSGLAAGNIFVGDGSNNASPVVLGGDATMSNLGVLTLANSGVAASTYKSVTVDAKGRVTAGSNPTTLAGYGITDAAADNAVMHLAGSETITGPKTFNDSVAISSGQIRIVNFAVAPPASALGSGAVYYDSDDSTLYVSNGAAWNPLASGGASPWTRDAGNGIVYLGVSTDKVRIDKTSADSLITAGGITAGTPGVAIIGTDGKIPALTASYLASVNGSALTNLDPTQIGAGTAGISISGNAATVTTNANLTGEVTSVGNAATLTNSAVIGKAITGFASGAGTVQATDSILQAINKLDGNDGARVPYTGASGNVTLGTYDIAVGSITGYGAGLKGIITSTSVIQADIDSRLASADFSASNVTGKLITGFASGAGAVAGTDSILQAINKLAGNDGARVPYTGASGNVTLGTYDIAVGSITGYGAGLKGIITSTSVIQADIDSRLLDTGDTMSGTLTLSGDAKLVAGSSITTTGALVGATIEVSGALVSGPLNYAAGGGVADSYTLALSPAPSAYTAGMMIMFTVPAANTGAATINVNSLGVKSLVKGNDAVLAASDLIANRTYIAVYDGTQFDVINPALQ